MQANLTTATVMLLAIVLALSEERRPMPYLIGPPKPDTVATEQRKSPRSRACTLAIVNAAMFEAINAVERGDTPYKLNISAVPNTSIEAAAASAATLGLWLSTALGIKGDTILGSHP